VKHPVRRQVHATVTPQLSRDNNKKCS